MKVKEALKPIEVQKPQKIEGQGSVWNTGSYHWEEKSVSKWADEQLKSVVGKFKYVWNDAHFKVKEIKEFKGEAGSSIRKGKKLVSFDYKMLLDWQCDMMDKEGAKPVATCHGTFELPEISDQEPMDSWEVRVCYTNDEQGLQKCLDQLIRNFAPKDLKQAI